jgi:hypothetical protein
MPAAITPVGQTGLPHICGRLKGGCGQDCPPSREARRRTRGRSSPRACHSRQSQQRRPLRQPLPATSKASALPRQPGPPRQTPRRAANWRSSPHDPVWKAGARWPRCLRQHVVTARVQQRVPSEVLRDSVCRHDQPAGRDPSQHYAQPARLSGAACGYQVREGQRRELRQQAPIAPTASTQRQRRIHGSQRRNGQRYGHPAQRQHKPARRARSSIEVPLRPAVAAVHQTAAAAVPHSNSTTLGVTSK